MLRECRFSQQCTLYGRCVVCDQMEGYAYGHKPGGCYRDLVKNGRKSTYWKESRVAVPDKELAVSGALQY